LVAHAVEATARSFRQGDSEAEIAGQLVHRLYRHKVIPERIQVLADGQGQRYRHWSFGDDKVESLCTIAVVGRREGLHVGAARTVSFGKPPTEFRKAHLDTLLVQATGMFFSQDQWEIYETWNRVERIYEKFGHSEEWHFSDQGCVTGYELCEAPIVPKSQLKLSAGMPIFWQSSIEQAMSADTILVGEKGFDVLTPMDNWPVVKVDVKGVSIQRPDVLIRSE
jgi:Xaa-Pro aminopeptidase